MAVVVHMEIRIELGNVLRMVYQPIHRRIAVTLATGVRSKRVILKIIPVTVSENLVGSS